MDFVAWKKPALAVLAVAVTVIAWRWVVPVALPFLVGLLVALAAEPLVRLLGRKLPRGAAAGIGVSCTLVGVLTVLVFVTALLLRQLGNLTDRIPALVDSAKAGLTSLQTTLLHLAEGAPEAVRPTLQRTVDRAFQSSGAVVEGFLQRLPDAISAVLSYLTGSAVAVGTGCLAAFMLSARLPKLRASLEAPSRESLVGRVLPKLKRLRLALWGWLKAQVTLSGVSFLILLAGLLLLRIPFAPLWAAFIALVDAVPLLGTGTVLVPWAVVSLLQGETVQAVGLLVIYGLTFLSRSTLEPKLVGKQLGLDPLLTLVSLYAGYRLWGIGGMLLSPLLCVVVKESIN